jgi:Tol biopolymer transport system component
MKKYFLILIFIFTLVGCRGTWEVGIERTPTPNFAATATVVDLKKENERLQALLAMQPPPPSPLNLGRVAYVQGGDIWVRALPDGRAQRLTTDGRSREPRWSPSGEWIMFRKEMSVIVRQAVPCDEMGNPRIQLCFDPVSTIQQQLWIVQANGSDARLLNRNSVEYAAWSPIEDRIAFVANAELQTIRPDGSAAIVLFQPPKSNGSPNQLGRIAWSPDGKTIACEWRIPSTDSTAAYQGLWQIAVDSKRQAEVYNSARANHGDAVLAGWFGNTHLLFWQTESKSATMTDGAVLFRISTERNGLGANSPAKQSAEPMLTFSDFISVAPSGNLLALVLGQGRNTWANKRIDLPALATVKDVVATSPAWSPDGAQLAYVAMPEISDLGTSGDELLGLMQRHIRIVSLSSSAPARPITSAAGYRDERPLWSLDGNYLLFARIDNKGRASLWIVPSAGGTQRQVIDELTPAPDPFGQYGHIDWGNWFDWWRG